MTWPAPGSHGAPQLDLPGVRISLESWPEVDHYAWSAEACGYVGQADTLPGALRSLADVLEGTAQIHLANGDPPAWWTRFKTKANQRPPATPVPSGGVDRSTP